MAINDIQSQNLLLTNYLSGVQGQMPEITLKDEIYGLGNEALFGSAFMLGMPLLANFKKPISVFNQSRKNNKSYLDIWNEQSKIAKANKAALKGNNILESYRNRSMFKTIQGFGKELPTYDPNQNLSELNTKKLIKYQNQVIKSQCYDDAKRIIEETKQMLENAKQNGTKVSKEQLKTQLTKVRDAIRTGDLKLNQAIQNGEIKPVSWFSKLKHQTKLKTGVYKAESALLKTTRGASTLKCASKCVKGAGWMAAIQGVMEIPDIINAYKIDKAEKAAGKESDRGNKQLLKSGVKVGTSVLGYAAGAAAAGAIVGSVFPGVGNVVGGIIGFVGGLIGGFVASKVAGKIMDSATGEKDSLEKSEAELYAEAQNEEAAKEAKVNANMATLSGETQDELLTAIEEQINSGAQISDEVLEAYKSMLNQRGNRILDLLDNIIKFNQ